MLLNGAVLKPRTLNDMDLELMRRHASTHDRINNLNWNRNRDSNRSNGYSQGGGHMRSYPPAPTPGVPPPNVAAVQWYQQTGISFSAQIGGGHNSGVLRLEDLQAQFGAVGNSAGDPRGHYSQSQGRGGYYNQDRNYGQQNRGGYGQDRGGYGQDRGYGRNDRGGNRGSYYQNQDNRYSGSGSGYRDGRWR